MAYETGTDLSHEKNYHALKKPQLTGLLVVSVTSLILHPCYQEKRQLFELKSHADIG